MAEPALTEDEEKRRGDLLIEVLGLRQQRGLHRAPGNNPPRVMTAWGDKTALGLYRTVKRIIESGE
jgi:hypothetical protein